MFVKADFQVLKLKFYACHFKQVFKPFHKYILRGLDNRKILLYKLSVRYLFVEVWSSNPGPAKSYIALQTVRYRFNIYVNGCAL